MENTEINRTVQQYVALKNEMKLMLERESELKKRLLEVVESSGEVNGNGHVILEVDGITLTKQRKTSNPLDPEVAKRIITEKGLEDTCMPKLPTLDPQAIMAALYKKELTEEDIDLMFPLKVSYAFLVKE
jgi:hypothetical protein